MSCSTRSYPSTATNTITIYILYFTSVNTTLLNGDQEKLFETDAFGIFFFLGGGQMKENYQPKNSYRNIIHNSNEFFKYCIRDRY